MDLSMILLQLAGESAFRLTVTVSALSLFVLASNFISLTSLRVLQSG